MNPTRPSPVPGAETLADNTPAKDQSVRELFDLPNDVIYLNCANMAPQLRSVTQAGIEAVRRKSAPWSLTAPDRKSTV